MAVTLIATVRNEERSILDFLDSVAGQSRPPDEFILVDGGSTDRTVELIRGYRRLAVRCVVEPCNIARGRNIAIGLASHPIIAVTDVGCRLDPHWLERITAFEPGVDFIAGDYRPQIASLFDACQYSLIGLYASRARIDRFPISARSAAFRRTVWEAVGGYPEFLDYSEDTYFHRQVIARGFGIRWAGDALVSWEQRQTVRAVFLQFFRYMGGDGLAGMNTRRHLLRFATYATGLAMLAFAPRYPALLAAGGAGFAAYLHAPFSNFRRIGRYRLLGPALVAIPALLVMVDVAKMSGYLHGRWRALAGRFASAPPASQPASGR